VRNQGQTRAADREAGWSFKSEFTWNWRHTDRHFIPAFSQSLSSLTPSKSATNHLLLSLLFTLLTAGKKAPGMVLRVARRRRQHVPCRTCQIIVAAQRWAVCQLAPTSL
jgi:hypothetical protein